MGTNAGYGGLVIILAKTRKNFGPPVKGFTWKQRFESLPGALPIFAVIAIAPASILVFRQVIRVESTETR